MNKGFNKRTPHSDEWETPQWLFDALDAEFGFTLEGAATKENAKCVKFCTASDTTLADLDWLGERVFCNPPYSNIEEFVRLSFHASLAVLVLPVRTDSNWHRILVEHRTELRYWRKRVAFLQNGKAVTSPRFATLIAVVRP